MSKSVKDLLCGISLKEIKGSFSCMHKNLTSLDSGPEQIGKDFFCADNKLESLKYSPKIIEGNFFCSYNKLESLKDGPEKVHLNYYASSCKINTIEYLPKKVGWHFRLSLSFWDDITEEKRYEILHQIRKKCKIGQKLIVGEN